MFSKILKKIKKFFTNNTTPKVAAVIVALILWVFVAASESSAGKFPGQLPIKAVNVTNGLVAIYDQKDIEIEIMAKPSVWNKLSASSFSAYVDMEGVQVGTYEMNVSVVCNVSDVKIINKNPDKIFVRIEEVISKKVVVNQRIEGNADEGLVAGNVEFTPAEVDATGPRSIIENISEAVATIKLNGESADFEKEVSLKVFSDNNTELQNVSFNPNKVKAKIAIIKGTNNKSVGIKVNLVGNPQDGYFVSKITTSPTVINITGQSESLQSTNYLETQNIDITGANSDVEKDTLIKIPSDIALQRGEPDRVRVIVSLSENTISRIISPKIEAKNLDSNLVLSSYSPSDIKTTLSGNPSIITTLDPTSVVLDIDLAGKGVGTYDYPITSSMIRPMNGISVLSVVPSSIKISISNK